MSSRTVDTRVDWVRVLLDLRRSGYSMRAFADSLGIARSTITGWMAGSEPKHADGEKLLAFWSYATGRQLSAVPREARLPGIRPSPTHMMRSIPQEALRMSKPHRARAVQMPGEQIQAATQVDDAQVGGAEQVEYEVEADTTAEVEDAQARADKSGRPVLTSEGWVLPTASPLPNLNRF